MSQKIQQINNEFRVLLENYSSTDHPARELLEMINQEFIRRGCYLYGKKLFPIFLKPYFIDDQQIKYIERISFTLLKILEKFIHVYFENPDIRSIFELTPAEMSLLNLESGFTRQIWITRNDAIMTPTDLKFIDFNCDSPGGSMYSDIQTELIENTALMKEIRKKWSIRTDRLVPRVLDTLLNAYQLFCKNGGNHPKEHPFIALVAGRHSPTLPEFELITQWLISQGYNARFHDPRDLECDNDLNLRTPEGEVIDIIYRRGRLSDWTDNLNQIKPLLKSYETGKVCVINPPHSILASNKHVIGLIQDPKFNRLFDEEEHEIIRAHLPWTRLMNQIRTIAPDGTDIDLYDFVRRNRERLVLKPMDAYGSKDVIVGTAQDQNTWEQHIEITTRQKYVVQEYIPIPEEEFPVIDQDILWMKKKVDVNFFSYGHRYAGGFSRASSDYVININRNGGLAALCVVEA